MAGVHAHRTARLGPGLRQGRLGGGWGRETDPRVLMGRNQWCSTGTGLNGCKRPTISGTDQASTAHSFDVVPVCAHACEHSRRCGALGRGSKEDAAGGEASRTARLALGRPPAAEPGAQRDPERYTLRMPTRSCPYGAGPQTPPRQSAVPRDVLVENDRFADWMAALSTLSDQVSPGASATGKMMRPTVVLGCGDGMSAWGCGRSGAWEGRG